jgi:hypothetical protein
MPSVLIHDDSCDEYLDAEGNCPRCQIHPDSQSVALVEVTELFLAKSLAEGRSFIGARRVKLTPTRIISLALQRDKRTAARARFRSEEEREERAAIDRKVIARARHLLGEEE